MGREFPPSYPSYPDFPSLGTGTSCFSSALADCGSYTSKATLSLIRTHIYGKLSQAEPPEELVNICVQLLEYASFRPARGSPALIQGPSAGLALPSLEFGPCPFFLLIALS